MNLKKNRVPLRLCLNNGDCPSRKIQEHQFPRYLPSQRHLRRRRQRKPDKDPWEGVPLPECRSESLTRL